MGDLLKLNINRIQIDSTTSKEKIVDMLMNNGSQYSLKDKTIVVKEQSFNNKLYNVYISLKDNLVYSIKLLESSFSNRFLGSKECDLISKSLERLVEDLDSKKSRMLIGSFVIMSWSEIKVVSDSKGGFVYILIKLHK